MTKYKKLYDLYLVGEIMAGKRRKKLKSFTTFSMVLIIAVICTVLYYNYLEMEKERQVASNKLEDLKKEYQKEVDRSLEIKDYRDYVQTKQFAEEIARKKFGLVYENEVIFKVGSEDDVDSDIVEVYDAQAEAARKEEEKLKEQQRQEALANGQVADATTTN